MTEIQEIISLDEFKKIVLKNKGYFLITCHKPSHYVHYPNCRLINENNFKKKIILNKKKSGTYFWLSNLTD